MHVSMPSVLSSTHRPRLYCKINSSAMHQWLLPRSAAFSRTSTVAYCSTRPACLNSHVVFPANQQCSWTTNHETLKRSQARAALVPSYSKRSSSMHRCNAYASVNDQSAAAEDFYSLLGIDSSASPADIKAAYRTMMRELHPDMAHASTEGHEEEMAQSTALAALLNEIYKTLTDPEARAVYDALAGFGDDDKTVNPMLDMQQERDQVFVDEVACIGCGKCVRQCPKTFEIEASKYGRARVISQTADAPDDIQVAIDVCPVSCMYWVTLPQLSLLEAALAVMPRVEVFILLRSGHHSAGNVFEEAYKAFERRRAARTAAKARAAAEAAAAAGLARASNSGPFHVDWSMWAQREAASEAQAAHGTQNNAPVDPQARRIAGLAASAARASRLWRQYGGGRPRKPRAWLAERSSGSNSSSSGSSSMESRDRALL